MTLKNADKDEHKGPKNGDGAQNPGSDLEASKHENATVSDQNGDLNQSKVDDIDDFVRINSLDIGWYTYAGKLGVAEQYLSNIGQLLQSHLRGLQSQSVSNH